MDDPKKILKIVLVLIIILLVYIGGCYGYKAARFSSFEKSADDFRKNLENEAFRQSNPNTTVSAGRSDDLFTPSGLLTVAKGRVQLSIHPKIFGGFDTDVILTDRFGGRTVDMFAVDQNGELLDSGSRAKYDEYREEIYEAMRLANEVFGGIYRIPAN